MLYNRGLRLLGLLPPADVFFAAFESMLPSSRPSHALHVRADTPVEASPSAAASLVGGAFAALSVVGAFVAL